jgi:hypothetical protein
MPIIEASLAHFTEVELPGIWRPAKALLEGRSPEESYYRIADGTLRSHGSLKAKLKATLDGRDHTEQFRTDVALWYGAIERPGTQWKADLIQRVFGALFYGGLLYYRGGGWRNWSDTQIPIAATISHTARVLVQLGKTGTQSGDRFWTWLWGRQWPQTRMAATHGVEFPAGWGEIIKTGNYVQCEKRVVENKKGSSAQHFGVNVALGGKGMKNPFSGKEIHDNGKHGHLYFAYVPPTAERNGAVLIACEQSAPLDRYDPHDSGRLWGWAKVVGMAVSGGVPDQYGGGHGLGGHNDYSATGGHDWTKGNLVGHGPERYLDGMFVDLSHDGVYNWVIARAGTFTAADLGKPGIAASDRAWRGDAALARPFHTGKERPNYVVPNPPCGPRPGGPRKIPSRTKNWFGSGGERADAPR